MQLTIEQAFDKGLVAHRQGDLRQAEEIYTAILSVVPQHSDANHNLGLILTSRNQLIAALPFFKTALTANPSVEEFFSSYVNALIKLRQFDEVRRQINIKKSAGGSDSNLCILESQVREAESTLSGQDVQSARTNESKDTSKSSLNIPSEKLNLLIEKYNSGKSQETLDLALSMSKEFPKHYLAWSVLGALYGKDGRLNESLIANRTAVELAPNESGLHSNLGITLELLGDLDEAISCMIKATRLNETSAEAHNNLGVMLFKKNMLVEAEAAYVRAIELQPNFTDAYSNLGGVLVQMRRMSEAEINCRQAISLDSQHRGAWTNLAKSLKAQNKIEKAVECYRKVIELNNNSAEAHNSLGVLLNQLRNTKEAAISFRKAIEINPAYAEALSNLGAVMKELGEFDTAEYFLTRAIESDPNYSEAHNNLGNLYYEIGRLKEAEVTLRQAIKLKLNYAHAYCNLGSVMVESGRYAEAEPLYRQAIELDTDFSEARFNLGSLLYTLGEFNDAIPFLESNSDLQASSTLLKCLYELNDSERFFDKLDEVISSKEVTSVIGSLTMRANKKYGKKKENVFVSKPMDYIVQKDLTKKYDFETSFVNPINALLENKNVEFRSQALLTEGEQTAGNIFMEGGEQGSMLKEIILAEIESYYNQFLGSDEGFLRNWPSKFDLKGWIVRTTSGGKLAPHMHEKGWISGAIYIHVPREKVVNSGNFVVCIDDRTSDDSPIGSEHRIIDVNTGDLLLFPASLMHYTIPFESDEDRVVLAFDMMRS